MIYVLPLFLLGLNFALAFHNSILGPLYMKLNNVNECEQDKTALGLGWVRLGLEMD